jgi:dimethylargininase
MIVAITRAVSAGLANCELSYIPRVEIDLPLARAQHRQYVSSLSALGCHVVSLPEEPEYPDAVFVEDVAIVLDELAVLARPGAASRRGEVASVGEALAGYRRLYPIHEPGTLEGGDVLRVGKVIYVGVSGRTNRSGVEQLAVVVAEYGHSVVPIEVHGCLHLKSAVSQAADGVLLINPAWVSPAEFKSFELIEVDPAESFAANGLLVGKRFIFPSSFPRTRSVLDAHGIEVTAIDVSELQKAEGGVTCCSLILEASAPR